VRGRFPTLSMIHTVDVRRLV